MENPATTTPGYRTHYNINPAIEASNTLDKDENPTGGEVSLLVGEFGSMRHAVKIRWQDGARGKKMNGAVETNILAEPNGAFVEDVIWAALQRLEFFNDSKYRDRANSLAITHLEQALQALKDRQLERSFRNVEGKHEV